MTEQERKYFDALVADRTENAKVLQKRSMRGVKDNAVNKYSDQAHFIYELLQNADDTAATAARFELYPDKLVFAHNGTRQFSISDPATEDEDSDSGRLGDINSITSYYNSTKTEASIGKFGIGFKAVLQYTSKPEIYDDKYRFCIENQVVPHELPSDYFGRQPGETLFVFPFVHAEKAYTDIANKLRSLSYPILFLSHLQLISFRIKNMRGLYAKETRASKVFGQTTAENIHLVHNNGETFKKEDMWLFSRNDDAGKRYSVGFSLDENGALRPVQTDAYCFFKTKEHTGLNFFIHAPFLLNDSREHIVAGSEHNQNMVRFLSELSADSLVYLRDIGLEQGVRLIDDNILKIIPTSENDFKKANDTESISFLPFFTAIREKMSTEKLLPTVKGYTSSENAYWADTKEIVGLLSDKQLSELAENTHAHWVFRSLARSVLDYSDLSDYIDYITEEKRCDENWIFDGYKEWCSGSFEEQVVFRGVDASFIEKQPIKWLHKFYRWLLDSNSRTQRIKKLPIFLNQSKKAIAAFDEANQPILFLPADGMELDNIVCEDILKNKRSLEFIEKVGIKKPSLRDYIYNKILPQYQDGAAINTKPHFKLFFDYYTKECPRNEAKSFLKLIKPYKFLIYSNGQKSYRDLADNMYFPDSHLRAYFADKPDTRFVDWDGYLELVGSERKEDLHQFLSALGVHSGVRIVERTLKQSDEADWKTARSLGLPFPHSPRRWKEWTYPTIDGGNELLQAIEATGDCKKALSLWHELLEIIKRECDRRQDFNDLLTGRCDYFYYSSKHEDFLSPIGTQLRNCAWLMNRGGEFVSPSELTVGELNDCYDLSDDAAEELIRFLQIKDNAPTVQEADDNLTDEQRKDIEFGRIAREYDFTADQLRSILERENQKNTARLDDRTRSAATPVSESTEDDDDRAFRKSFERQSPAKKSVLRNIMRERSENAEDLVDEDEVESDENTPPIIDFQKRIRRAEEKSNKEIEKIASERELSDQLAAAPRYTCTWFRTLMELEALSRSENESGSREISISFGRVELEPGTERTLLLKQPSRYIPHWMEDLAADVPLTLQANGREHRVMIEVASVKGYTLHTRLRNAEDVKGIDLSRATARISVQNPSFLLESLQEGFAALELPDDYDLKAHLSENIKFVFGPPGTGKTTYLAREELIPLMRGAEDEKVLVLAPTNKAADVLAARIMELMGEDASYKDWLVRFGTTYDEKIEQSDIYKDRSFYLPNLRRCVLITTIARFPYDSIGGQKLHEVNWDRVVIDEASMIPIANIIYPLYQVKPKQFIIAGDPLQIQPVAQVEQDENIYKMVGLKSFTDPHTEPHDYVVKLLTTQYRSVPSVGEVFSRLAYGGVLEHARSEDSRRLASIDDVHEVAPLNIIKFPVSKYEGIYRAKRLGNTRYHIYSALLAYEFAAFLARKIGAAIPGGSYSIGVISPYRAQADLIDRLLARAELPAKVRVQAGTIHGFQGDECDTIIAVFNPPPTISDSKEIFLNKLNIINVSISRARDCLFVLMPDEDTEHIGRLKLVNRVERLIKDSECFQEYRADEIEELIFGRTGYLEENTFSTSHQNVNVYGLPEKRYEVRSEDTAIDVQIHEGG